MDIDMRELEAFAAVVEQGGFSRAAHALFLTQPTISSHISSLERKLNIQLLVRTNRSAYPSEAGKLLYGYVREILRLRTEAVEAIEDFSRGMKGVIHIAASTTPGRYYLPEKIDSFQKSYPDISFQLDLLDSKSVAAQVAARTVDLGFTGTVISLPACVYHTLTEDALVIAAPNTAPYRVYLTSGLSPRQLSREPFIFRERGSSSRMEMEHFLHSLDVNTRDLHIAAEAHSTEELLHLVSRGRGVAVVPQMACVHFQDRDRLLIFPFSGVNLCQQIYLVRHKSSRLSPIAQTFVRTLSSASLEGIGKA